MRAIRRFASTVSSPSSLICWMSSSPSTGRGKVGVDCSPSMPGCGVIDESPVVVEKHQGQGLGISPPWRYEVKTAEALMLITSSPTNPDSPVVGLK